MDKTNLMLLVSFGGVIVFLVLLRVALGPLLPFPPPSHDPMKSVYWNLYTEPERPWVPRARDALARLPPQHRPSGELAGWTWRPVEREPAMTVKIDERSSDGRRIRGLITGTPGTLEVDCSVRTALRLLDGWITLTPDGGQSMTLRAGDSLVIHPGFSGSWQNETLANIHFEVVLS